MVLTAETPFRFLDLPAELREIIYKYHLYEAGFPAMSHVNHQIRSETLPLFFYDIIVELHLEDQEDLREWTGRWMPAIVQYFRTLLLVGYQHSRLLRPRRHMDRCSSAIKIDLKQEAVPVTYQRDILCAKCPLNERGVDRVDAVVKAMEQIEGRRQLTKESFLRIIDAAAWEVSPEDFVLGISGHAVM